MLNGLLLAAAVTASIATAAPQDAQSIMAEVDRRQAERTAGVQDYLKVQTVGVMKTVTWHEKVSDGVFRQVPFDEIQRRSAEEAGRQPIQLTEEMAAAYELTGEALRQGLQSEGFPADGPFDPRNMFDPMAAFIRAGANMEPLPDGRAEAASEVADIAEFARRAVFVGREEVDGRDAFHLRAENLQDIAVPQSGSGEFRLESASLYIDPEEYVPIKMVIEGRGRSGGDEWMPITIEKLDQDYRRVGPLYESHLQIMRLGGIEEAMAEEMREMRAQLEQLPPSMRQMIEGQIKNAMNQFEAQVVVDTIIVNTGVPTDEQIASHLGPAGP